LDIGDWVLAFYSAVYSFYGWYVFIRKVVYIVKNGKWLPIL